VLSALQLLGRFPELYAVNADQSLAAIGMANRVQAWTLGASTAFAAGWTGR
jgi:hypothetical protein